LVHQEVAKLPTSLRLAFVLCELEGVGQPVAAEQLGIQLSTLSGNLARARQMLLERLTKRGVNEGLALIGTAIAVPQAVANKAMEVVGVVPKATVIELATEITAMKLTKLMLLAAGLMVTCGLTVTGYALLSNAEGQVPASSGPPRPELIPDGSGIGAPPGGRAPIARRVCEYLFVAKPGTLLEVSSVLRAKAVERWEYVGPLDVDPTEGKNLPPKGTEGFEGITRETRVVLVFKRALSTEVIGGMPGMGGPGGPGGIGANQSTLKFGRAGDVAKTLREVFGAELKVDFDERNNTVTVTGPDAVRKAANAMIVKWDVKPTMGSGGFGASGSGMGRFGGRSEKPVDTKEVTMVYKMRHETANAELVGRIRTAYADTRGQKTSAGLAIAGDDQNNSLVV
jgi:hypothetical protein